MKSNTNSIHFDLQLAKGRALNNSPSLFLPKESFLNA